MLPEKILELKNQFMIETSLVEKMIKDSMEGLIKKDDGKLKEVMEKDEPSLNQMELEIEENCINIIALFHPEAVDLRTVLMIFKMNNDLERIGDLAVNICQSALFLIERPDVIPFIDLPKMGEKTIKMLRDSITSFTDKNTGLAIEVCKRDDDVDNLADQFRRELITYMISDAKTIERAMHLLRISRNLERISDHSTNIAEDVIFMAQGKVIKHGNL